MGPAGCVFLLPLLLGISGTDEEEPEDLVKSICGRPAVFSGIVSGLEANVGQWPWQVSIRQGLSHVCAASLISKQWVLTVASCFRSKDPRKYEVLVGSLQVSGYQGPKTAVIPVSRIIPYPGVQGPSSAIAVAELARPLSFSPLVLPICLPTSAVQLKNAASCWVTGWDNPGIFQYADNPTTLQEAEVPIIEHQKCENIYNPLAPFLPQAQPVIEETMVELSLNFLGLGPRVRMGTEEKPLFLRLASESWRCRSPPGGRGSRRRPEQGAPVPPLAPPEPLTCGRVAGEHAAPGAARAPELAALAQLVVLVLPPPALSHGRAARARAPAASPGRPTPAASGLGGGPGERRRRKRLPLRLHLQPTGERPGAGRAGFPASSRAPAASSSGSPAPFPAPRSWSRDRAGSGGASPPRGGVTGRRAAPPPHTPRHQNRRVQDKQIG
ncbi:unnamed protein product [Rangifer tarandus platyrhynchus]|uniref:Peptidase S1 domain-containing protein n=1 Tax=Rangifer tarandus platyrhynchus TaxID=3082113 RepID=A0ABN8Y6Z8_RANTA|nr:unnamed protein product [Rangifer tarandus platyrhynchus]